MTLAEVFLVPFLQVAAIVLGAGFGFGVIVLVTSWFAEWESREAARHPEKAKARPGHGHPRR